MGLDQGNREGQSRLITASTKSAPDLRILIWILLALAACSIMVGCEKRTKIGNDRFSAIVLTQHTETLSGKKIVYPNTDVAQIESHLVTIKPGGETGRHYHPGPTYMYVMEGILVVQLDDGAQKEYRPGQDLLEDGRVWVNNKNPGSTPTKFLAVIVGERGQKAVVFPQG